MRRPLLWRHARSGWCQLEWPKLPRCGGSPIQRPENPFSDLPPDVPLFIARGGCDEVPQVNETLDRFITHALAANLPLTVANHATGPHAFD